MSILSRAGFFKFALNRVINNDKLATKWEDWVASHINVAKDEKEREIARYLYSAGLTLFRDALFSGDSVLEFLASRRGSAVVVLRFIADNIEPFMGDGIDIPLVPEVIERLGAQAVRQFILSVCIPWCDSAPLLNG